MFLRTFQRFAGNSILHPVVQSTSVLAHLFQEGDFRARKEEWTIFSEQMHEGERKHRGTTTQLRVWLESMVQNKDSDAVTKIVKYVRESSGNDDSSDALTSYHYHCLFRVFVLHKDRASVHQLFTLMEARPGLMNANTVAWSMWYAWRSGNTKAVVEIFQTVACTSREMLIAKRDGFEDDEEAGLHSPVLSVLLYALTHVGDDRVSPSELGVVVAAAMRLFRIELTAQDYISFLLNVLEDTKGFTRVRNTVIFNGMRSQDILEEGSTSLVFLTERLEAGQMPKNLSNPITRGVLDGLAKCAVTLGIDPKQIVKNVGFVQVRCGTLEGWVRVVLECVARDVKDPAPVYDAVVTWAHMHHRHVFVSDMLSHIASRLQAAPNSFFPMWTTVCQLADSLGSFPAELLESVLPRYLFVTNAASNDPAISEQTQDYLKTQQLLLTTSPKEMHDILTALLQKGKSLSFSITREAFRCCLDACARYVPLDCKMTKGSLQERYQWWLFNDCRDVGLVIYGAVPEINLKIRKLYQRGGVPEPVKALDEMESELKLFQEVAPRIQGTPPTKPYVRRTRSITNLPTAHVPERMTDPQTFNAYPHVYLQSSGTSAYPDPFPGLFQSMKHIVQSNNPQWYVQDKETTLRIVRCFLHRLDWENAIQVMSAVIQSAGYSTKSDRDLQRIFAEIGDPSGSVAFKLAARILEGDVSPVKPRHQSAREKTNLFHNPQQEGAAVAAN